MNHDEVTNQIKQYTLIQIIMNLYDNIAQKLPATVYEYQYRRLMTMTIYRYEIYLDT